MADNVLLVTGGGRGIGAATCRLAAKAGYALVVNYISDRGPAEKLQRLVALANTLGTQHQKVQSTHSL